MTKVKRKALSIVLICSLILSVIPQAPALAAKAVKKLADSMSDIIVTSSSLADNDGYYPLENSTAEFVVTVASGSDAWVNASGSNAKASISNATSSDAAVATVGLITEDNFGDSTPEGESLTENQFWLQVSPAEDAVAGSTATVTVSVEGLNPVSFNVKILSNDPTDPDPTVPTITITTANGKTGQDEVEAGKTLQLTASILPEDGDWGEVEWYSSSTTHATVDNTGLITALQPGLTTVGFTLGGENYDGSMISILVVPEKTPPIPAESIIIKADGTHNSIGIGETRELFAHINPTNATNQNMTWSTSDESIATVTTGAWSNNIKVTGVKAGKVTITATADDGSNVSGSIVFEVLDIEDVNSVVVNNGRKIRVRMNTEKMPSVTTNPKEAAGLVQKWTSSNPEVLKTGEGWIYGVSEGTATLSVTIKGVTGTCDVEVWAQQLELALSRTKMNLQEGKETKINALITLPDVGSIGMTEWESSNPEVLEVTEGVDLWAVVKAKSVGKAVLTATLDGKEATCEIIVTKDAVAPTPADKIDAIVEANQNILENGTPEEKVKAASVMITAIQEALKSTATDAISEDDLLAVANLEELILGAAGDKFHPSTSEYDGDVELNVNEIVGALLNLPTDWPGEEPIQAVLTVGNADTTGLVLPEGVTGARAFDIKLSAVSDSRTEELNDLNVPIEINMDVPDEFTEAKNLWVYNYHGNDTIKIKPTVKDNQMSIIVNKFSTFVMMDVPEKNNNNDNNNSSSSGGSSSYVNNTSISGQWVQDSTGWWFKKASGGYPRNEWAMISSKWYHFNAAGYMETGWILLNNSWYYLKPQGDMANKEWILHNGKYYYLHENGTMMSNQWFLYKQNWYYMSQDGSMLTDTTTPDGNRVDVSGIWIK